ncbi:DUF4082 domain-containing protein [Streptosporangium sp. NPDC051022]|uniref:DUF4082 domain-containing protein n=1 Tax=Streptosporangium sp. NPDC051022 TaxID=3155752 RepID=UPI00342C01CD
MSNPHGDAPDQAAGTAAPTEPTPQARPGRPVTRPQEAAANPGPGQEPSTPATGPEQEGGSQRHPGRHWLRASVAAVLAAGVVTATPETAQATPVSLGTAVSFAVLARTAVNNTNLTSITGDVGVSPGSSITGFPPGTVSGAVHAGDPTAAQARTDLNSAYADVSGRAPNATVAAQLGGTTQTPGVYNSATGSFTITGTLTLDAQGDPDAVFVFQASTFTASNVSNINLLRGAQANNVFWQVSGTASLGTFCTFRGNVLAQGSVTVSGGAAVFGRLFSLNSTVTTQGTTSQPATRVTVPNDPPTTTALVSASNPSWKGAPVTFTATVQAVSGSVIPQGEVVFKDGTTIFGSDFLDSSGQAVYTTSGLDTGDHPVTAVYLGGDTFNGEQLIHFAPSKSAEVDQVVSDSLWNGLATPETSIYEDSRPVTVGVKFQASTAGTVTGVRFYKGSDNTGTHIGSLWDDSGDLLADATYTGESASGWQQVDFDPPVAIAAGTTYIAAYHTDTGYYSTTRPYFTTAYTNGFLTALADGTDGGNGVYNYGAGNTFPTNSFQSTNYWVDPVFAPSDSIWDEIATPDSESQDSQPITLGVKFQSSTAGTVTGVRFYKGPDNTGTHIGSLWDDTGDLLADATYTGESASGWQQVLFDPPVAISAGTTYIAAYHSASGFYSTTRPYFTSAHTNGPLTALADGTDGGNGVYGYGASSTFPTNSYQSTNYWVDVIFHA